MDYEKLADDLTDLIQKWRAASVDESLIVGALRHALVTEDERHDPEREERMRQYWAAKDQPFR